MFFNEGTTKYNFTSTFCHREPTFYNSCRGRYDRFVRYTMGRLDRGQLPFVYRCFRSSYPEGVVIIVNNNLKEKAESAFKTHINNMDKHLTWKFMAWLAKSLNKSINSTFYSVHTKLISLSALIINVNVVNNNFFRSSFLRSKNVKWKNYTNTISKNYTTTILVKIQINYILHYIFTIMILMTTFCITKTGK